MGYMEMRRHFKIRKGSEGYPSPLAGNGPEALSGFGDSSLLSEPMVALLGSRETSPYGNNISRYFADLIVSEGMNLLVPAARGCASTALASALNAIERLEADGMPHGRCVVVTGCGADVPFPEGNAELYERVVDLGGTVVTGCAHSMAPTNESLAERDDIVAAMATVIIATAASFPSHAMDLAAGAMAAGKPCGAVPGRVGIWDSMGTNELLKQGASPVVDAESFERLVALAA